MKCIKLFLGLLVVATLSACGGGGSDAGSNPNQPATIDVPLFTTIDTGLQLAPGETVTRNIGGGKSPYTVTSSNRAAATVVLDATGVKMTITGVRGGMTTITVTDSVGATKVHPGITVTSLPLITEAPSALTLRTGQSAVSFKISGGFGNYAASSSNPGVLQATVVGSNLNLLPKDVGSATVTLKDESNGLKTIDVVVEKVVTALVTTAPSILNLMPSQVSSSYEIRGGEGPYVVSSSNPNVVTAAVSNSASPATFKVTSLGVEGVADLTIIDAGNRVLPVKVQVSKASVKSLGVDAPAQLTLTPGQTSPTFTISGGSGSYGVVSSNANTAQVTFSGGKVFNLTGVAAGTARITVSDVDYGGSIPMDVTVDSPKLFRTLSSVSLLPSSTTKFAVGGGTPPYTVASNALSVVTVTSLGNNEYRLNAGSGTGAATVMVTDAQGTSLDVSVNVNRSASAPLMVNPLAITGLVGETLTFVVSDGVAPYTATSTNASVVEVSVAGKEVLAKLLGAASGTTVVIRDAVGQAVEITVSASASSAQMGLSPSALTISELDTRDMVFYINGGVGPFIATSSNSTLAPVSVVGNQVIVGGGPRCFRPTDWVPEDYKPTVTVSVVDSLGAAATSVLTIHNDLGGLICP